MMARLCWRISRTPCRSVLLGAVYVVILVFVANLLTVTVPPDTPTSRSQPERAVSPAKLPTPPIDDDADRRPPDAGRTPGQPQFMPDVRTDPPTTTAAPALPPTTTLLINNNLVPQLPLASSGQTQNGSINQNNEPIRLTMRRTRNIQSPQAIEKTSETTPPVLVKGQPYPLLKEGSFIPPHRIVHFDLKGAPFKPAYFKQLFPLLAHLNATGVLIEWEDMFPYTGKLADAVNGNAYTLEEVKGILQAAKDAQLDIIPLVQTFGHLEWILKLEEFASLREHPSFPQVRKLFIDAHRDAIDTVRHACFLCKQVERMRNNARGFYQMDLLNKTSLSFWPLVDVVCEMKVNLYTCLYRSTSQNELFAYA